MIGVIFTGGTIGSSCREDCISPDTGNKFKITEMYEKKYGHEDFLKLSPCYLLSENINMSDYGIMYDAIRNAAMAGAEGIILTHGSDTVMYTAALFSYIYEYEDIPLMIVCSNYVPEDPESNALINFASAVDFIKNHYGKGVFVPYTNRDNITRIYYGSNILGQDMYSDEIRAAGGAYYGEYTDKGFRKTGNSNPCIMQKKYMLPAGTDTASGILVIHPYPGMVYPDISGYKAVIHGTYHSGTICTSGQEFGKFINNARNMGIPVYLTGVQEGLPYESCMVYEDPGLIVLPYMTEAAAYMKLWLELHSL